MNRRAVVTGIGAVSPNGVGREQFWSATWQGKSGIRRIKSFDPASLPVHIAGEIPDFEPARYIGEKDASHVGRVEPLAVAAAREAVEDAGIDPARSSNLPLCLNLRQRNVRATALWIGIEVVPPRLELFAQIFQINSFNYVLKFVQRPQTLFQERAKTLGVATRVMMKCGGDLN